MAGGGNKGNRRWKHKNDKYSNKTTVCEKGQEVLNNLDEDHEIIKTFQMYAAELDDKHDRYERIVKIGRDITIESKRIIFLLHNVDKENKREEILKETETRLQNLVTNSFKLVAKELENQDNFQYIRAYTAGLQEFVEAFTFYQYLKDKKIEHWSGLETQFLYQIEAPKSAEDDEIANNEVAVLKNLKTPLPAIEFILGLADLSGELMRKCINSLGSGNIDDCFHTCNFVREMYKGFLIVGSGQGHKEIGRKVYVLKQSLHKMEMVCYNITVRGDRKSVV